MGFSAKARRHLVPFLQKNSRLKNSALNCDYLFSMLRHSIGARYFSMIKTAPRTLGISLISDCNQRCLGCNYGRDFLPGKILSLDIVKSTLDDARALGFWNVIFYGGEPLLHPDLPKMVEYATDLELPVLIITNGTLLREKIDDLYSAGARNISIGFYGTDKQYDEYVQRDGMYLMLEKSMDYLRGQYGAGISFSIHWLLSRSSCNLTALENAWKFVEKYEIDRFGIDLVHDSAPYLNKGPEGKLQFCSEDRENIISIIREVIKLKNGYSNIVGHSLMGLRSIPDWLVSKSGMRIPCDRHSMVRVGPDGTVQLCPVQFQLGNLNKNRLKEILFGDKHKTAALDCYRLNCPNCHYGFDSRIQKHWPSRRFYGREGFEFNG